LRQCRLKRIEVLIIPTLDRLSRDVRLAENLFWQFERYDVRVLIADMPSYNNEDRREVLVRQIREAIAEDNRKEIIERLLKGRQERIRKGRAPGGNTPYGYRRDKRTLVRDEGESVIVQTIFAYRKNGVPVAQIADGLNRDEFLRRNGKSWTSRMVRSILSHITFTKKGDFTMARWRE